MINLSGKTALVTGGSRGIGKAIAAQLVELGADVMITGTNEETLRAAAAETGATRTIAADLGTSEGVQKMVLQAGGVDILVNNAGITRDGLFLRQSDEQWNDVVNVNLSAAAALSRGLLPHMLKQRSGRIINVTSIVGHTGNTGQTNYVAAKAGLTGFTKALAQEVSRKGITVNCVAPGFIETAMTAQLPEKTMAEYTSKIAMRSFGTPEDIAQSVAFLASDAARYITGTTLHVDGGMVGG